MMTTAFEYAIYHEATAGDTITTTEADMDYDTNVVTEPTGISRSGADVTLTDSGHFLVMHSTRLDKAGAGSIEGKTIIEFNAANLAYGVATSFALGIDGTDESQASGAAIIDTGGASRVLTMRAVKTSSSDNITRAAANTGLHIMRLDDSADYFRARYAGTAITINNGSFAGMDWDTQDEYDTGTFTHSTVTNAEQITLKTAGHYLVCLNVMCHATTQGMMWGRLRLNGTTTIAGGEVSVLTVTSTSAVDGTLNWMGIIDVSANDVLSFEMEKDSGSAYTALGSDSSISIVKLDDTAEYIRLGNSGAINVDSASSVAISWDTEHEKDTASFGHDTVTNNSRVEIDQAGDYLFFGCMLVDHSEGGSSRAAPVSEWGVTGAAVENYNGFGQFARDGQSWISGKAGGIILDGLGTSDYVEMKTKDQGNAVANMSSIAARIGLQGVRIGSLSGAVAGVPDYVISNAIGFN